MKSEEPVFYSDSIDPVQRSTPNELFFIMILAHPKPESEECEEVSSVYVNCWLNVDDLRAAERRAFAMIDEQVWRPYKFEEWKLVDRSAYADEEPDGDEPDVRATVEPAFLEGESCIFYTWSKNDPDADSDNDAAPDAQQNEVVETD